MLILLDPLRNMFDQLVLIVDHQHTIKHILFLITNDNRKVKKLGTNIHYILLQESVKIIAIFKN